MSAIQDRLLAELVEEAKTARHEEIKSAESRIAVLACAKGTILSKVAEADQKLQEARATILEHARTGGLLTKPARRYLNCIYLSQTKLKRLLHNDEHCCKGGLSQERKHAE